MKKFSVTFELEAETGLDAMKAAVRMVEAAGCEVRGNGLQEVPEEKKTTFGFQVQTEDK